MSLPNANIIFSAQVTPPKGESGWHSVVNAAIGIQETASVIMLPGRLRSNGQPVPVRAGDYTKYAAALARAGKDCLKAAQFKNYDGLSGCTDNLSQACDTCHNLYRDPPPRR